MNTIREWLLVGRYVDCLSRPMLAGAKVGAILQLAAPVLQTGYVCQFIPTIDGNPIPRSNLRTGVDFIREQKAAGRVVLVACMAGISRSVSFATAALHEEEGVSLLESFRSIHAVRAQALPHARLWESLCAYYNDLTPYERVLDIAFDLESLPDSK